MADSVIDEAIDEWTEMMFLGLCPCKEMAFENRNIAISQKLETGFLQMFEKKIPGVFQEYFISFPGVFHKFSRRSSWDLCAFKRILGSLMRLSLSIVLNILCMNIV